MQLRFAHTLRKKSNKYSVYNVFDIRILLTCSKLYTFSSLCESKDIRLRQKPLYTFVHRAIMSCLILLIIQVFHVQTIQLKKICVFWFFSEMCPTTQCPGVFLDNNNSVHL